jgi:two-component system, NtrC family, response regulator AtoC
VQSQAANKKVLLVDDEVAVRDLYSAALERHGLVIFTAATVREALKALHDLEFDVAVIDLQLADGHGMEIMRRARMDGGPRLIAMSGFPQMPEQARELESLKIECYNKLEPLAELVRLIAKS